MRLVTTTTMTCPRCGTVRNAEMPLNACQHFWECERCGTVLKPKEGRCCVFCSYGDVECPPGQAGAAVSKALRKSKEGVLLDIEAAPGAKREAVGPLDPWRGRLRVAVSAPPEKGKANAAVLALLARETGVAPAVVELAAGASSRMKTVLFRGMAVEEVADLLVPLVMDKFF